jgi:hypothetical protein
MDQLLDFIFLGCFAHSPQCQYHVVNFVELMEQWMIECISWSAQCGSHFYETKSFYLAQCEKV